MPYPGQRARSPRLTTFCPEYVIGRCGKTSWSFPAAIRLPVKVSEPRTTSAASTRHHERRGWRTLTSTFRRADQRDADAAPNAWLSRRSAAATAVIFTSPSGDSDDRTQHKRDGDPPIFDDLVMEQRPGNRQEHPHLPGAVDSGAVVGELIHFNESRPGPWR